MSLLLQLNGDLPSHFPDDERRLHIFGCRRQACSRKPGSIRALREVRRCRSTRQVPVRQKDDAAGAGIAKERKQVEDLGAAIFGTVPAPPSAAHANPFSMPNASHPSDGAVSPFASLPPTSSLAAKPPQTSTDVVEPSSESFSSKLRIS